MAKIEIPIADKATLDATLETVAVIDSKIGNIPDVGGGALITIALSG